jgi:hypothetical protein
MTPDVIDVGHHLELVSEMEWREPHSLSAVKTHQAAARLTFTTTSLVQSFHLDEVTKLSISAF